MWEKGLTHDPVERYTPGRTHDGTAHLWIHPNVRDSCFGGKLVVDGSLLSKHGAQGGQAGWAVVQVDEASHELVCVQRTAPCLSHSRCNAASCGQSFGLCCKPYPCRSRELPSSPTARLCFGVSNGERNGARRDKGHTLTCGARSGGVSKAVDRRRKWTPC